MFPQDTKARQKRAHFKISVFNFKEVWLILPNGKKSPLMHSKEEVRRYVKQKCEATETFLPDECRRLYKKIGNLPILETEHEGKYLREHILPVFDWLMTLPEFRRSNRHVMKALLELHADKIIIEACNH